MSALRPAVLGIAGLAGLAGLGALARRRLLVVTVSGHSMEPTLPEGARLLVVRGTRRLRRGTVVVLDEWNGRGVHDGVALIVKRVAALPGDPVPPDVRHAVGAADGDVVPPGHLVVLGDGVVSADSRHWGYAKDIGVLGVMAARIA